MQLGENGGRLAGTCAVIDLPTHLSCVSTGATAAAVLLQRTTSQRFRAPSNEVLHHLFKFAFMFVLVNCIVYHDTGDKDVNLDDWTVKRPPKANSTLAL